MSNNIYFTTPQPDLHSISSHRNSTSSTTSTQYTSSPFNSNWEIPNEPEEEEDKPITTRKSTSTFISKLYNMVNDDRNQHLIFWNPNGTSFLICNASRFSREILPEQFKHANFSSFVRQLNMYGFHKINKSARGQRGHRNKPANDEFWEFSHPKFKQDRPELLEEIKRKAMDSEHLRRETSDMQASFAMVQLSQAELSQQFRTLQQDYARLLQVIDEMKQVQLQQQWLIRKLAENQGLATSQFPCEFS
ncbi:HSF-type DNA-binding-domain-containing protein [Blakeslea trispora]|nr:HSF-type DNA-binding-domain-containing protein [Blakeslea trispora]